MRKADLSIALSVGRRDAAAAARAQGSITPMPREMFAPASAATLSDWTDSDAAVLAAADRAAERNASLVRLATAVSLAVVLTAAAMAVGLWDWWAAIIVAANMLIASAVVLLTRLDAFRSWMVWALCIFDAGLLAAIGFLGPWFDVLTPGARAALVSPWVAFLLIALAALYLRASVIVCQTILLSLGFALLVWSPGGPAGAIVSDPELLRLFSDGTNVARVALLCLTGLVLAVTVRGARDVLRAAIRSSRERSALQRFVPPEVERQIVSSGADELRRGDRRHVSVLFADIRGFSHLAQTLPPESVASLLNSFRARVARAVGPRGGVIDKFIGDGVLVVFGITEKREGNAANALAAALALTDEFDRWRAKRTHAGRPPIGIGVGLHCGEVFVGALGHERMEFTVIGDTVNVAQRLEEMTRQIESDVIVSADLFHEAALEEGLLSDWLHLPNLILRGRNERYEAFALRRLPG